MLGLWPTPFHHYVDDIDYERDIPAVPDARKDDEDQIRNRKRQRRSIFFAGPDSDSEDDDDAQIGQGLGNATTRHIKLNLAMVPATPYSAHSLCKGSFALTPSFPRRSSSPCLELDKEFVAVHEEPNAGYRSYMEDRSAKMTVDGVAYLGIFDGHGGIDASTFLQRHLLQNIKSHLQPGCDVHDALTSAYSATNAAFRATGSIQGSTATTVILQKGRLIAANVGDSPAFVVKKSGEVYSVIQEHRIEGEEAARIAAQGVPIYRSPTGPAYMGTPDGTRWLNMSRAFGDFVYPAISCEPHVCSLDVSDGRYLVMGSDGLTEKWSVSEAAEYVTKLAAEGWGLASICQSMVARSLARGSTDNISCMIVDLEAFMLHADAAGAAASASPLAEEGVTMQDIAMVPEPQLLVAEISMGRGGDTVRTGQAVTDTTPSMQREVKVASREEDLQGGILRFPCDAEGLGKHEREEDTASADLLLCEETPGDEQQLPNDPNGASLPLRQSLPCQVGVLNALALATTAECGARSAVSVSACNASSGNTAGGAHGCDLEDQPGAGTGEPEEAAVQQAPRSDSAFACTPSADAGAPRTSCSISAAMSGSDEVAGADARDVLSAGLEATVVTLGIATADACAPDPSSPIQSFAAESS